MSTMPSKPFVLAMGGPGVEKSSLLNALMDDPKAFSADQNPKVVETDALKMMDSGCFPSPHGNDSKATQKLLEQFKEHGAPSAVLLCCKSLLYDQICQKIVSFLQRVFGHQTLTHVVFVLTQQGLKDNQLKEYARAEEKLPQPPAELDDRWRQAIMNHWTHNLAKNFNRSVSSMHEWLGEKADLPALILDSQAWKYHDEVDGSETKLFKDQKDWLFDFSRCEPLRILCKNPSRSAADLGPFKPFVFAMGGPGVGKSSLLNALMDDPKAFSADQNPKVVETDALKMMDSGCFPSPHGNDSEATQKLLEQFKEHGAPSAVLLCSAVGKYDEVIKKLMSFLHGVFGDQVLAHAVLVLTKQVLDDKRLKMYEKSSNRDLPQHVDDEWRQVTVQRWRKNLAESFNNGLKQWLGGIGDLPALILDSQVWIFPYEFGAIKLFNDQRDWLFDFIRREPLRMQTA
ncbi:GTPase IMAP family member 6 (Immunity-associated nucleotide 6 protein) (IAN-6) [Durusdinium trenchii]|uniref:GTPase IMAP family member 6 (Immunity-associated nucleotide 6 protein) (IAN-6) n=1 Tax=Durusdinium trenchii TaxID=1381693 RepID=A0ABP0QUC8_9DINO